METSHPQLTPEQRQALLASPNQPVYIADDETQKVYVLVEKGRFPELEQSYIQDGLDLARAQIARGEVSNASIEQIIDEAKWRDRSVN